MFQILKQAKELEKQGKEVFHFEIGDPDFSTPEAVVEACVKSLRDGETHYTVSSGLEEFKQCSREITMRSRGFRPDLNQVLVTSGANVQLYYALACAVNPGEEVIVIDPAFVSYVSIMGILGIVPVPIALKEENGFRLDPDDVEKAVTPKTRMIIINSPHNPTGAVMKRDEIERIYYIAEKHDVFLLSDEVYGRMIYDDGDIVQFHSPSIYDQCKERTILVHSFSKTFAMTGWRIGAVTAPAELVEKMALLLETTSSCVSPFIQKAAIEAMKMEQDEIARMMNVYRQRRDILVERLNNIPGIRCLLPEGAFYAFANIKATGLSSQEYSQRLLNESGVATCPGIYFGPAGEGYVRYCFAVPQQTIEAGLTKVAEFHQQNGWV